jgi:hypothetical protein
MKQMNPIFWVGGSKATDYLLCRLACVQYAVAAPVLAANRCLCKFLRKASSHQQAARAVDDRYEHRCWQCGFVQGFSGERSCFLLTSKHSISNPNPHLGVAPEVAKQKAIFRNTQNTPDLTVFILPNSAVIITRTTGCTISFV